MWMIRSITFMSTASAVSFGMKSGVQPCIGCGLKAGWAADGEPSGLRSCVIPLAISGASSGSQTHDLGVRHFLGEHARHALQRAAGAVAGHPVVELLALEVVDDLARRGARMDVGVGLVLELAGQEPAVRLGELDRLGHHADAAPGRGREHHLGAEKAHQPAPLDAELLGHGHDQRIALGGAHHREPDAGVAAGRLDHRLAGLELARLLGGLDDAEREAVLHRAERVERLDLDEEVDAGRRQLVDPHHGRVADGLEDVLKFCHELLSRDFQLGVKGGRSCSVRNPIG